MQPPVIAFQRMAGTELPGACWKRSLPLVWLVPLLTGIMVTGTNFSAAEAVVAQEVSTPDTNGFPHFDVRAYFVEGDKSLATNLPTAIFSKYTGTNLAMAEIVRAAAELQLECRSRGYPTVCVAIAAHRITNGLVPLSVFRAPVSQILVSGKRYSVDPSVSSPALAGRNATTAASTNAGPRFHVRAYAVAGDTLLSERTLTDLFKKYTGTNIGVSDIIKAASDLQMEYRDRGFPTVSVTVPQQQITNDLVHIQVFEGKLSDITVTGNRFFSSNNIRRALPSLQTNMILHGPVFQAELDQANANQDRQIYPKIEPGPEPNTTSLDLKVKDRLPLHAKFDFNNQSSPGTPEMRLNSSAVYNNLWQLEQSVGVQYSFSPERFKSGNDWEFYDRPLVANYSGFYRLPLGNPDAMADVAATGAGTFGYDEATRKFQLPPSSGLAELNFYGSRSAIDTSVMTTSSTNLYSTNGNSLDRRIVQQDLTINEDIGTRFNLPVPPTANFRSSLSGGLDYKGYTLTSYKTNIFTTTSLIIDDNHGHPVTNISIAHIYSPVPSNGVTRTHLDYVPLALRYDASFNDRLGVTSFGLGMSASAWYSGSSSNLQTITGSPRSSGRWILFNPTLSRDFLIHTNWTLTLRADGQWASEPLISNEQFGAGGVASVRGYREGDVFGDTGWHVGLEQKTPGHFVGMVAGNQPLTIRGSVFMDYAESYLLDPQGRNSRVPLWGAGFGIVAAVGVHWETRLIFGWPLESTPSTPSGQPRFNFSLTAQY